MAKFIACYIRKSVIDDPATASPERQRAAIERVIPAGFEHRYFEDLDLSGRTEARPGWQALLAALTDPDCAGVACEALDRLYRNRTDFGAFKARLEAAGQQLIIANLPGIDGTTAGGNLFLGITAEVAEFEARVASERMTAHVHHLQVNQGRHWGRFPFGCDRDASTRQLIPSALTYDLSGETRYYFDALHQLYTTYAPGSLSCAEVADALNAAGWRHWGLRRDDPQLWHADLVRDILRMWPLYAGQLPPPRKSAGPRRVLLEGGHAPILPVELCRQVGATMQLRARLRTSASHPRRTFLLTGLLFCGDCGEVLTGQSFRRDYGTYYYYRHRYHSCGQVMIAADVLESQALDALVAFSDQLAVEANLQLRLAQEEADRSDGPAARLAEREAELERLIDLRVSGLITRDQFEARRQPIQAEIETMRVKSPGGAAALEMAAGELAGLLAAARDAEPVVLKQLVGACFERLEARDGKLTGVTVRDWLKACVQWGVDLNLSLSVRRADL